VSDDWRLPRLTSNLIMDWMAALHALKTATTAEQLAAVMLRIDMLRELQSDAERAAMEAVIASAVAQFSALADALREQIAPIFKSLAESLGFITEAAQVSRKPSNTGPPKRWRAPRRIGMPRGRQG